MIMFRAKIDPQTVVSFQSALPKLIITLLIITFSYAIAGLMIDLLYIIIYLLVSIFKLNDLITSAEVVRDRIFDKNIFQNIYGSGIFTKTPGESVSELIKSSLGEGLGGLAAGRVFGNVLFTSVMAIILLFVAFRLFISLLICYVSFVAQVIFAPLTLLFNALPGSKSLGNWIKGMLANIMPFVAVALMFMLAAVFMGASTGCNGNIPTDNVWCVNTEIGFRKATDDPEGVWVPPFMTVGIGEGTGGTHPLLAMIGLGMILMTPKVAAEVKKMLQVEPSGLGGAIMAPVVSGVGTVITGVQQLHEKQKEAESKSATQKWQDEVLNRLGGG
jgi:hypothetical protein